MTQPGEASDLNAFLQALKEDGERKIEEKRLKVEEEIAELISVKRIETEKKIKFIQEKQSESLILSKKDSYLRLRGEAQLELDHMQENMINKLENKLKERLQALKMDPDSYSKVISELRKDLTSFTDADEDMKVLNSDGLGGFMGEDVVGGVVIDNTFETRLERLFPEITKKLALRFEKVLEKHPDVREQLRIS